MTEPHTCINITVNGGIVIELKEKKQKKKTIEDLAKETREIRLDLKHTGVHILKKPINIITKSGPIKIITGEVRTKRKNGQKGGFPHIVANIDETNRSFGPGTQVQW